MPDPWTEVTEVLDSRRPRRWNAVLVAAALVLVAAFAVTGRLHARHSAAPPTPEPSENSAPVRIHAPDLSLAPLRHFVVTESALRVDREVLRVAYRPTPTDSHVGGTITLFTCCFDGRSFRRSAERIVDDGRVVYFGQYRYQRAIAWPVGGGRWVCLCGFIGAGNGADPDVSRAEELRVATGVVVR